MPPIERSRKLFIISAIALCLVLVFASAALATHGGPHGPPGDGTGPPGDGEGPPGTVKPGPYLSNLYIWFLGFVGIAALFAIVWGGIQYMFSGANLTKAESGRTWITNAIWGIILAASAYLILYTINPDLVTHGFDINKVIDNALKTK